MLTAVCMHLLCQKAAGVFSVKVYHFHYIILSYQFDCTEIKLLLMNELTTNCGNDLIFCDAAQGFEGV